VPRAVRAEYRQTAGLEDGTDHRRVAVVVQMAVEAAVPVEPVLPPGARTSAVACAPAATAVDEARPACWALSAVAACTPGAEAVLRRDVRAWASVRLLVWLPVSQLPLAVPAAARCAAA
jgi:hypothetical protein